MKAVGVFLFVSLLAAQTVEGPRVFKGTQDFSGATLVGISGLPGVTPGNGSSSPLLSFNMTNLSNLFRFNQGESGFADFGFAMGDSAGSNGESRRDRYMCWGYNLTAACDKQVVSDQALLFSIENHFKTVEGIRQTEFYMTYKWPNAMFSDTRFFAVSAHTQSRFIQMDLQADQINLNDSDGNRIVQFSDEGFSATGAQFFFNASTNRAQLNFGGLSAQRTYTFPDSSGSFLLIDSSGVATLPGGLIAGSGGSFANKIGASNITSPSNVGTFLSMTGDTLLITGRDPTAATVSIVPAVSQTQATVHFTNSSSQTKAAIMPDGIVYATQIRIGTDAEFANTLRLTATVTANRTVAFPDFSGTALVATGTTGSGTPLFGSNSPAITLASPYTWLTMMAPDGSTVYVPAWK